MGPCGGRIVCVHGGACACEDDGLGECRPCVYIPGGLVRGTHVLCVLYRVRGIGGLYISGSMHVAYRLLCVFIEYDVCCVFMSGTILSIFVHYDRPRSFRFDIGNEARCVFCMEYDPSLVSILDLYISLCYERIAMHLTF